MKALLIVVGLVLCGCGPDPVLGTYTFNQTGQDNVVAPMALAVPSMSTGSMPITDGARGEYVVLFSPKQGAPCTIRVLKSSTIQIKEGEVCDFSVVAGPVTASVVAKAKAGTATLKDTTLTIDIEYDFTGMAGALAFTGTGKRNYVGTRVQ
jgi:hypothetical protein